jgi:hypothetical protein
MRYYLIVFGLKCLAISGSCGPHKALKALTTFSYLISRTIEGPLIRCSINGTYSGKTPLYTSKNSSALGLSKLKSYIAEMSKPSFKMISMI